MTRGTNLPLVRSYNQQVVLEAIRVNDGASRVEIARRTGLTAQTVSNIVRRLLDAHLIEEAGRGESSGGKPRVKLRINAGAYFAVGVQIDACDMSLVVIDMLGRIVARTRQPTHAEHGPSDVLRRIAHTASMLIKEAGVSPDEVLGVGVASPGPLDHLGGVVFDPPNLAGWHAVPVKDTLEQQTGFLVVVDNDATAAAIGERWSGGAYNTHSFAFIYLGTGLGAGLFLEDRVYRGSTMNAGEFGHMTLDPRGPACFCGNTGCLEALCSPRAIADAFRARLAGGERSFLRTSYENDPSSITSEAISNAATRGDQLATRVLTERAELLGYGITSLVNLLDLELVVLGGTALRDVGELYRAEVERTLRDRAMHGSKRHTRIDLSVAGEDAGPLGAATLILHTQYAPRLAGL